METNENEMHENNMATSIVSLLSTNMVNPVSKNYVLSGTVLIR